MIVCMVAGYSWCITGESGRVWYSMSASETAPREGERHLEARVRKSVGANL